MLNLGELKLGVEDFCDRYYVTVLNTHVMATNRFEEVSMYDTIGEIKVCHSGFYPGDLEDLDNWIQGMVIDHVIDKGYIVKDSETVMGETIWAWK